MNVVRCFSQSIWSIAIIALMTTGCASVRRCIPTSEDISPKRQERNRTAARQFDQKRDLAEFEAANSRWRQGDVDGSTEILKRLLERNPDHLDARLLIAELLLTDNRPEEAVPYLEPAVAAHPDDARVQHTMALALDSLGQTDGALVHYERAAGLEPGNEVYAVSYAAAVASQPPAARLRQNRTESGSVTSRPSSSESTGAPSTEPTAGASNVSAIRFREPAEFPSQQSIPIDASEAPELPIAPLEDFQSSDATVWIENSDPPEAGLPNVPPPGQPHAAAPFVLDREPIHTAPMGESMVDSARYDGSWDSPGAPRPLGALDSAGSRDSFLYAASISAEELIERGTAALADGTNDVALAYFREATALRPDDPQILISAAVSALRHNQPAVAVTLLEPFSHVFRDSAALHRILAAAHYRLGDYESSQVALLQALSLDKSSGLSYFLMGCTLAKLGQSEAAETHFRQARRLDPRYAGRR